MVGISFYCIDFIKYESLNQFAYKVSEFFYDLLIDFPEAEKEIKTLPYYEDYMIFKPFSESFNLDIGVIYKNIKFKCPVALLNKITLKRNNQCYDCFIMLIPNEIGADLIIVSHKSDMSGFLSRLKNNIETLSFIESCMMLDGEWWLLPSVIKKWSDEKIKFVEDDFFCFYERPSLLYESYEVSLFDDLRLEFCKDLPNDRRDIELKKINTLPKREPIEERKRKYRDWWMDFNIKTRLNSTSS